MTSLMQRLIKEDITMHNQIKRNPGQEMSTPREKQLLYYIHMCFNNWIMNSWPAPHPTLGICKTQNAPLYAQHKHS